ncbi:hypothetical protein COV13_02990 [Candidatus Woesearchaeota archaeon CG10_big_fil_rev_8_21_14_0_10_32_9]|nr:MAG: hypothetical protein COV13_02990 [Candidatus Woesearchaeota archaeon CG10_big_fil_rev_8_21_14_0_10_32_9]
MSETIVPFDKMPLQKKIEVIEALKQKRQQELKELEENSKSEAEKLNRELLEAIDQLSLEDQKEYLEEQEKKHKEDKERSLEQTLEGTKTWSEQENTVVNYSKNVQPMNIYELTDYNLYSRVKELVTKAEGNFISPEERNFLSSVAYNIEKIKKENPYQSIKQYDSSNYLSRASNLLQKLDEDINRFKY